MPGDLSMLQSLQVVLVAIERERAFRGPVTRMSAEILQEGFERMTRLCNMANAGCSKETQSGPAAPATGRDWARDP